MITASSTLLGLFALALSILLRFRVERKLSRIFSEAYRKSLLGVIGAGGFLATIIFSGICYFSDKLHPPEPYKLSSGEVPVFILFVISLTLTVFSIAGMIDEALRRAD